MQTIGNIILVVVLASSFILTLFLIIGAYQDYSIRKNCKHSCRWCKYKPICDYFNNKN